MKLRVISGRCVSSAWIFILFVFHLWVWILVKKKKKSSVWVSLCVSNWQKTLRHSRREWDASKLLRIWIKHVARSRLTAMDSRKHAAAGENDFLSGVFMRCYCIHLIIIKLPLWRWMATRRQERPPCLSFPARDGFLWVKLIADRCRDA